ncbi:MAG: HepT-like ribonuclease domain-containing protein [Campylobacterota bacterium]|nr:HepT-like ribonuclease domain-containing protein [Campylobacterota bacterium]
MSKESISNIYLILEKIDYIETIVEDRGSITLALEDAITSRAAILMHLTAIAEQFHKLKLTNQDMLSFFNEEDVKGMYDVRTYIAHEYDGVNLAIVEWIIRNGLPKFKEQCQEIINTSHK